MDKRESEAGYIKVFRFFFYRYHVPDFGTWKGGTKRLKAQVVGTDRDIGSFFMQFFKRMKGVTEMKRLTQKLKAAVALMLCVIMASGSLTAFAEENTEETNGTSILSDNFDELERRAQELQQPEALSEDEGIVQQTYANARSADFTIDLTVGSIINYNGYQTHQYSLSDGTVVYCIEPTRNNPSGGSYTASLSGDSLLSAVA